MPLTNAALSVTVKGDYSGTLKLASLISSLNQTRGQAWDAGTGTGQVDKVFSDTRTLAPSATEDLDMAGTLLDAFGATITFARIRALLFAANPANANNITVGANAASNAMSTLFGPTGASGGTITLPPGAGCAFWAGNTGTGYVVTASTADLIHVVNTAGGTSVTYDVVVIGCSV